jgi:hypothetical protein
LSAAVRALQPWPSFCWLRMTNENDDESPLRDFYAVCDGQHREFFSSVLYEWREAGLPWEWQDGDIALCVRTAGKTLRLLHQHAGSRLTPPSITYDLTQVRIRLGDAEADRLLKQIQEVRGVALRVESDICNVAEPGNASGAAKHALRAVLRRLAAHLPGVLAP